MIMGGDDLAREPGQFKGLAFFGASPDDAEREAPAYTGYSEPAN